jgi:heavy metal efflux system protein
MLNKIIQFSIKNKLIVGVFVLALIAYGAYEVNKLPIDALPDITNNQVQVISVAPSLGAADIERLVTFPIEQASSNIPGIVEIRSFSRFGLSLVTIVFKDNIDVYWARQQVSERLQVAQSQIPPGIAVPELGPVTTGLGEIYQYVVRAKEGFENQYDATELRTIQDWIVRRQLLSVKGVADVSSFGGKLKQYEISVNPDKLQALNVNVNEIFDAVHANNANTGGAYIEKGPNVLYIRSEGLAESIDEIQNICIKSLDNGNPILIKDVAQVKIGSAIRYGAMTYNDVGEVSGAVVMMLKGGNSSEIIKNVKERVAEIQKTLPEGVVLEPFLDRSKMVNNAIHTVEKNLLEGALIVIFVLVLFLGNLRAGLIVASVIPLSMLVAIILMNLFGVSGNLMSLGALDFGLIVDGAVIIVESVMHAIVLKGKGSIVQVSQKEMDETVASSSSKMMNSAVFGQIIILVVYLPIFTLEGIEGKMFVPMAQTVSFALIGAFILSLTYVPMMSSLFISKKSNHKVNFSDKMMLSIEKIYRRSFNYLVNHIKLTYSIVMALFISAIIVLMNMGGEFIPTLEEGDFALETRVLPGSNLNVSIDAALKASKILKSRFSEVEKVVSKIGSGEVPTDPMPIDAQDLMIILKDKSEWENAVTFDELADTMGKALEEIAGVNFGFLYPVQMRFNELMTGAKQDIVCKIFGENLDTLVKYANLLGSISNKVEGAQDIYVEPVAGLPQIVINYKREIVSQYGLSIDEINRVVNTALAGQSAGLVFEGEKRFDLVVRMDEGKRDHIEDVRNLPIPTQNHINVPLSILANVDIKNSPNQIQREDAKRRIFVGFNVKGKDMQTVVDDLRKKVDIELKLPAGYYITYGGAFENLKAAKDRMSIAVPVALLLIFLMLYFAFNSIKLSVLIYSAIPLSTIGGILALSLRGMPFSISAGVGFIALFGVSVLNGIVLIAEFKRRMKDASDLKTMVLEGTASRLRPVLMTALVASLGFFPMALSHGAGAEVQRPLATVVIGGLLIATFLTLYILPMAFYNAHSKQFKGVNTKILMLFAMLSFVTMPNANAQKNIDLNAAIDSAMMNNLHLQNQYLMINQRVMDQKAAIQTPQTQLMTENGQINSSYFDNRLGVSQSFYFPSVYAKNKSLMYSQKQLSEAELEWQKSNLKREVSSVYHQLAIALEKKSLLMRNDSIYQMFEEKSNLRYKVGESNLLEKSTSENQRYLIQIQLLQLENEIVLLQQQFKLMLNTRDLYLPKSKRDKIVLPLLDSNALAAHPYLKVLQLSLKNQNLNTDLEQAKKLPEFNLAYSNMTMKGFGSDNNFYTGSNRFHSFQLGIGIPLFASGQKASVQSSKIGENIIKNQGDYAVKQLESQWNRCISKFNSAKNVLDYYEEKGLKNNEHIQSVADQQLQNGSINYMDWVLIVNQSIDIQLAYLDALNAYNQAVIELQTLMNK